MRLLIINDGGARGGGTENRIRLLLEEFRNRGIFEEIHILYHKDYAQPPLDGVTSHICDANEVSNYKLVKDILFEHKIDVVQSHNMVAITPFCLSAAFEKKMPVIWSAHDYWLICPRRRMMDSEGRLCQRATWRRCIRCTSLRTKLRTQRYKYVMNKSDVGISASCFIRDIHERHGILRNRWQIVLPWIDIKMFSSRRKDRQRLDKIVFTGPLSEEKGALIAALAMRYVVKQIPDAKLHFFGDSQQKDNILRRKIEEIGEADSTINSILFGGEKQWEGLKEEYATTGVYISPTIWNETFGLNWAEALATGCPVVASRVGSIPERMNRFGMLIEPGDPRSLADAIVTVLRDKQHYAKLAEEGSIYVRSAFDVSRAATELIALYRQLIE